MGQSSFLLPQVFLLPPFLFTMLALLLLLLLRLTIPVLRLVLMFSMDARSFKGACRWRHVDVAAL